MDILRRIALALVIIGALNWGLIGFFQFDLVATIFGGQGAVLSRVIYALVGLSGLYCIGMLFSPLLDDDKDIMESTHSPRVNYGTEFGEDTTMIDDNEVENTSMPNDLDDPNNKY